MACWTLFRPTLVAIIGLCFGGVAHAVADETASAEASSAVDKLKEDEELYELYKMFVDTVDQVERNYVKKITRREIMEAAIEGIITKLDPHSSYINPDELKGFKSTVESEFGGIGIQISMERGQLKILSPLVGKPAYRAGLQAGDRITKIEGVSTEGMSIDEAVKKLKGEIGTGVTLTVVHANNREEETVTVQRELIHVETVLGDKRTSGDQWDYMFDADKRIGYIRLTAFSRDTANELKKALEDLKSRNLSGLILDLRFNPGGLLTSAIEISDMFLPEGKIVSTSGRNVPERVWEASKPGTFEGFPMVILVNRYSASASEIVSAALQDHKRAIVIGERTWGKGSVQNVIELDDRKSALKLTTASYQRPSGKNIHRFPDAKDDDDWGVRPNDGYDIRLSDSEMYELVQNRKKRDIVAPNKNGVSDTAEPDESDSSVAEKDALEENDEKPEEKAEFVDRQLQKAVEYLTTELARAS